jgi:hypothetical protein
VSSFGGEEILVSEAHAPKSFDSLSDADKLADASLLFHTPEFLAILSYKLLPLEEFLKQTLMPKDTGTQKAYLDLITSVLLNIIEAYKQYEVLPLAYNSSRYLGNLISELASAPGVMTSEEKAHAEMKALAASALEKI